MPVDGGLDGSEYPLSSERLPTDRRGMRIQKILVPTDLSPEGERAFPAVAELARQHRATIVLLHVVESVGAVPIKESVQRQKVLPGTAQELDRARTVLELRRAAFPADANVAMDVVIAPSVPHAVVDYAERNACDLIALSTHGRQGFRRMIVGSVTEAVLRQARVPVLVFPRQE